MSISTQITGMGYHIPDRKISNSYVLDRLVEASRPHLGRVDLDKLAGEAESKMELAGCRTRYWCREDEFCTDIALAASRRAVADAGIDPKDIDYLIFTGMSKAFVEPASAHVLRHALGAESANVIDTQDACTSFIKSLQIADSLIRSGVCRTVLIASGERTFDWADFECTSLEDLAWKFGSLTIGDGAGALVLQATSEPVYTEAPYHFHLAYSMVGNTFSYCHIGLNHGVGERYKLKSHSKKLFDTATLAAWNLIMEKKDRDPEWADQPIDRLLFHDVGNHLSRKALPFFAPLFAHMPMAYFSYFEEYGNVASSSLPLSLSLSRKAGRMDRGDHVMFICPAGGVQAGIFTFIY